MACPQCCLPTFPTWPKSLSVISTSATKLGLNTGANVRMAASSGSLAGFSKTVQYDNATKQEAAFFDWGSSPSGISQNDNWQRGLCEAAGLPKLGDSLHLPT